MCISNITMLPTNSCNHKKQNMFTYSLNVHTPLRNNFTICIISGILSLITLCLVHHNGSYSKILIITISLRKLHTAWSDNKFMNDSNNRKTKSLTAFKICQQYITGHHLVPPQTHNAQTKNLHPFKIHPNKFKIMYPTTNRLGTSNNY